MKKAIVLLLALAVLGGAVFADDAPAVSVSGAIFGGVIYDNAAGNLLFSRYKDGAGYWNMFRARLNFAVTNDTIGAKIRLQSNDFTAPSIAQGLVWANFFDGALKIKTGKLDDYTWSTWYNYFGNFDGAIGTQFIVKPMDGLTLGAFLPVAIAAHTTEIADQLKDIDFGMAYSIEGVGKLAAGFQMAAAANTSDIYVGFDLTSVENLGLTIEAKYSDLGATDLDLYVSEYVTYALDALSVGAWIDQTIEGSTFGFSVAPEVEYALDALAVGASATFSIADVSDIELEMSFDPYVSIPVSAGKVVLGAGVPVPAPENFVVYSYWEYLF